MFKMPHPIKSDPNPPAYHEDEARSTYYSLAVSHDMYRQFPRFVNNLLRQQPDRYEMGRVANLEFKPGERAAITHFENSTDLLAYLDDQRHYEPCPKQAPRRRLWLVEDISRNYLEILGSRLRIPPSFFAAHWADPSGVDFNERDSFVSNPRRRFILKYPNIHRVNLGQLNGNREDPLTLMDCNVERYLFSSGQEDSAYDCPLFARSYHNVSFWSSESLGGSWDAVLLLDPPIKGWVIDLQRGPHEVDLDPDGEWLPESQPHYPSVTTSEILPSSSKEWMTSASSLEMLSIFDDIVSFHRNRDHDVDDDPRSCTVLARKIVIANWIAFLRRRYLNLLRSSTLTSIARSPTDYVNRTNWLNKDLDFRWQKGVFSSLVNARYRLDALEREISGNMRAVGVCHPIDNTPQDKMTDSWEARGWSEALGWISHMTQMMKVLTQGYQHAATIQEAQTANDLSRSVDLSQNVARITNFAVFFAPISAISGIFSMGGSFLPGESRSWVFWAVSLPVVIATSLILFTNRPSFISTRFRKSPFRGEGHGMPNDEKC